MAISHISRSFINQLHHIALLWGIIKPLSKQSSSIPTPVVNQMLVVITTKQMEQRVFIEL